MEKRPKKALARTLDWGTTWIKIGLTAVLFVPPLLAVKYRAAQVVESGAVQVATRVEKPQPKQLVKIFSIVKSNRPRLADKEAWKISTTILDESAKRDVDPMLVLAVIKVESGFQNQALSPMGARGIMQIMPETGRFLSEELYRVDGFETPAFMPHHLDDPEVNIKLGVYYLDGLKKQFRTLNLALLAYNFGPGEIQNRLENNIDLSDGYAALVLTAYREFKKVRPPAF